MSKEEERYYEIKKLVCLSVDFPWINEKVCDCVIKYAKEKDAYNYYINDIDAYKLYKEALDRCRYTN